MKRVAVLALGVVLLGLWGCSSKPELTMRQKKTVEYLEAIAAQKDREAVRTESLAMDQLERAKKLREEAEGYRQKARLVIKGQDIDEMEQALRKARR